MMAHLTLNVRWALAGLAGVLLLATMLVWLIAATHRDKDYSELKLRTRSWWVMVAIFAVRMIDAAGKPTA